jgi:phosphonopyruvate decarboxylase
MLPSSLLDKLLQNGHSFLTGVPDSVFKHFLLKANEDSRFEHVITNNEGESCALAAGYHLATGKVPVVYMQNSGLGNCVNPLSSLLDEHIYSIPALLLIGWRAVPGEKDEPQHKRMGAISQELLTLLGIPHAVAGPEEDGLVDIFRQASDHFQQHEKPFAILFPREVIGPDPSVKKAALPSEDDLMREDLLESIVNQCTESDLLVTTTGKTSRELYEIRERLGHHHANDFLTVGSMGCAASIALGIAMQRPERRVILVDGDGACLMRMEALATIGAIQPANLLHILVDNNAYESTGSQPTLSNSIDFAAVAKACNYRSASTTDSQESFSKELSRANKGPTMLVVKAFPYSRPNLGRPKSTPVENKLAFMEQLGVLTCKL